MAGCSECKFEKSTLDENFNLQRKCSLGKHTEINEWWFTNGGRINEKLDDMECQEYHNSTKILIYLNNISSELLALLKSNVRG